MFPLADARGRIVGFQARRLREDDPLRGKYVNSPESQLFHKSAVLYGLHLARTAIAKQERAVVVEGNTDVIALRQAGFEPVVASMGTGAHRTAAEGARAPDAAALPLLRRRRGRRGRHATRDGDRDEPGASTSGS
jgi:DNA primase